MKKSRIAIVMASLVAALLLCPALALAANGEDLQAGSAQMGAQEGDTSATISFERSGEYPLLYSDGTATLKLNATCEGVEGVDWDVVVAVGKFQTFDEATHTFDPAFVNGEYTYDSTTHTVTLYGAKIMETIQQDYPIVVRAWIIDKQNGNILSNEDVFGMDVLKARIDYGEQQDRDMLPDWDGWIDGRSNVHVENSAHPDGADLEYEVTSVGVQSQNPDEAGEDVVEIQVKDDGWQYIARGYGEATLKVTYAIPQELGGGEGSYTFKVNVKRDVYELYLDTESGSSMALPGGEIALVASAWHKTPEGDKDLSGATYRWKLGGGSEEFATLQQDSADPAKAVVKFKDLPEGQHGIWEDVWVEVELLEKDDQGVDQGRASSDIRLTVADSYVEIWPCKLDKVLEVGGTLVKEFEVRSYWLDNECEGKYSPIENVSFRWSYDENAVDILDSNGERVPNDQASNDNTFTIKRKGDWGTDIGVIAEWLDGDKKRGTDRHYWLDDRNYDIGLNSGDTNRVFDDGTPLDVRLDIDDSVDAANVSYMVGLWNGDNDTWEKTFDEGEGGAYTISPDNKIVMLNGAKLLEVGGVEDFTNIRVFAKLTINGKVVCDADHWVEVREVFADFEGQRDCNMLPGWDGWIDKRSNVHVENSTHPNGADLEYEVTNVGVQSQNPEKAGEDVIEIQGYEDNRWRYTAKNHGRATVKVDCKILDGSAEIPGSFTFDVGVGADVYEVAIDTAEDSSGEARPGESIELIASARHENEEQEGPVDLVNPRYEWRLSDNAKGFAEIDVDRNDSSKATVTFKGLSDPAEYGGDDKEAWIDVELFEGDESRAGSSISLRVVVNIHDLDSSYTDMYFTANGGVFDNRLNGMNPNYHVVSAAHAKEYLESLVVRTGGTFSLEENAHNGYLLEYGKNYQVSYYKVDKALRTLDPSSPEELIRDENVKLDAVPTTAGSYLMKIDGKKPFYNSNVILIDIQDDITGVEIAKIPNQSYNGSAKKPKLAVSYKGQALTEGKDFAVTYANNTAAGPATATITGINPIKEWTPNRENGTSGWIDWLPANKTVDRFFKGSKSISFTISKAANPVTVTAKNPAAFTYSTAARALKNPLTVSKAQGAVTYANVSPSGAAKKNFSVNKTTGKVTVAKGTPVGTYTVTISATAAGNGNYNAKTVKTSVKFTVVKAANALTVKPVKTTLAAKAKANTTIKATKAFKIAKNASKGTMTYKKASGDKKITIAKNGKITVKKGLKKGKTYTVKVKATSAATKNYKAKTVTVTLKIKVS